MDLQKPEVLNQQGWNQSKVGDKESRKVEVKTIRSQRLHRLTLMSAQLFILKSVWFESAIGCLKRGGGAS